MSSFSFNCPQCGKVYENVKSKMAGCKVRCNCGKIFRLGPKTEKQKADAAARKAKRRAARNATENQAESHSPPEHDNHSSPAEPVVGQTIEYAEEVLEAIPVDAPLSPKIFEDDPLLDLETGAAYVEPMAQDEMDFSAVQKEAWALATPTPFRKKAAKPNVGHVEPRIPVGGAIWTMIYALPASLIQGLGVFALGGPGRRDSVGLSVVLGLAGLVSFVLAVLIFISGVCAIIEIVKNKRIKWPSMAAAYAGIAMIGANVLVMGLSLAGMAARGGGKASAGGVGTVFIMLIIMSVIPATAAITGFVRNMER